MSATNSLETNYSCEILLTIGRKLYLSTEHADVFFTFKSGDRIPAHKNLLIAGSDVFQQMFNGSWKEKDEVKIVDTSVDAFKEFLQFFYLNQINLTIENVAAVMNLGEQYIIAECSLICEKFVRSKLTDENVCWAYELAIVFNRKDLKKICEIIIVYNAKYVLKSTSFLETERDILKHIMALLHQKISEVVLFEACMSWVKAASKMNVLTKEIVEKYFGVLFYGFHFCLMTLQEFAKLVPKYGHLFTSEEYSDIIQITTDNNYKPKVFKPHIVELNSMLDVYESMIKCIRSNGLLPFPHKINSLKATTFTTNKPLLLFGIDISITYKINNNKNSEPHSFTSKISIIELDEAGKNKFILCETMADLDSSKPKSKQLPKLVFIKPNVKYVIQIEQLLPNEFYTNSALKNTVQMEHDILIQFENKKGFTGGLIAGLHFFAVEL